MSTSLADLTTHLRRQLHPLAEESLKEYHTQRFILTFLTRLGVKAECVLETGVLCYFDFHQTTTLAFRTDMDGLKQKEQTNLEFASKTDYMHSCGHDGHMAMMLAFAERLCRTKTLPHNILLIFQPAEEGPGRGREMSLLLKERKDFAEIQAVFAFHLMPTIQQGSIALKEGGIFAGSTELYFHIHGQSAHVSQSTQASDALRAGAMLVSDLYTIKETIEKHHPIAFCIGEMHSGERMNIIAAQSHLYGTVRYYDEATRMAFFTKTEECISKIEQTLHVHILQAHVPCYPPVQNDAHLHAFLKTILPNAVEAQALLTAEDFSYYAALAPSYLMLLGTKNEEKGFTSPLHSPQFNFDESVLAEGVQTYEKIARYFPLSN